MTQYIYIYVWRRQEKDTFKKHSQLFKRERERYHKTKYEGTEEEDEEEEKTFSMPNPK